MHFQAEHFAAGFIAAGFIIAACSSLGAQAQDAFLPSSPAELVKMEDVSLKLYIDYRKGTLIVRPKNQGEPGLSQLGDDRSLAVFQPNAGPALGLGLKLGPYLSGSFSRSVYPWQRDQSTRGHSMVTHYELHWYRKSVGADLHYERYGGLFLHKIAADDLGLMGDALFRKTSGDTIYPDMTLRSAGANVFYTVFSDAFVAKDFMNQGGRPTQSGWSPLIMASYSQWDFGNPDPLLPADMQPAYNNRADALSGGRIRTGALLPGIGAALVEGPWSVSGIAFWGLAVQDYHLFGSERRGKHKVASTGNLRGSAGYAGSEYFYGVTGYKSILTTETQDLSLTTTTSLVEISLGRRF